MTDELVLGEVNGKLEEMVPMYMTKKDQKKLMDGMKKLKKKYPDISKECFG